MKNQTGHVKEALIDENGFKQFIINCFGASDQRKYFSISPFGIDFNAPVNTRILTTDSQNKDQKFSLGVLNLINVADLAPGESAIFSTDEPGENLMAKIVLRNSGGIEITALSDTLLTITGNAAFNVDGNATIAATGDVNLNADGNVVVTATQFSANGNLTVD